jgi:hypothetical protein
MMQPEALLPAFNEALASISCVGEGETQWGVSGCCTVSVKLRLASVFMMHLQPDLVDGSGETMLLSERAF